MRVQDILQTKGDAVYQISPAASLADAVERLAKYKCGSMLVTECGEVVGIISERDILRTLASETRPLADLNVGDFMTSDLIVGHPDDSVESVMGVMTSRRIRHLPIMDGDRLAGLVSIGDVVKAQFELLSVENHYLKVYIQS
jgi:CBS domain-containing protein